MLSDTLVKATPLIFTGLASAVAFRMRLWNIGTEGQLLDGGLGRGGGGAPADRCQRARPAFIVHPRGWAIAGVVAGGIWAGIAGWLKARLDVNGIITTLMLVLHRGRLGAVLGLRAMERGRVPALPAVPTGGVAPSADGLQRSVNSEFGGLTVQRASSSRSRQRSWSGSCSSARARATRSD